MASDTVMRNIQEHHADPETRGEWAMSVSSLPAMTADLIVAADENIRQAVYRFTTAQAIRDAGYEVVSDEPPHALVLLSQEPTDETIEQLQTLFSEQADNPYRNERKGRRGR